MFDNQQKLVSMVDIYVTLTQLACTVRKLPLQEWQRCKTVHDRAADCLRLRKHGQAQGGLDLLTQDVPSTRTCAQARIPMVCACIHARMHMRMPQHLHRYTVRQQVLNQWRRIGWLHLD